jgi:hypothetical protein
MKTLNSLLNEMERGFRGPKHDQGTRKPGEVGPKKFYKDNTVTSEKGGPSAATLGDQEFIDDHEVQKIADRNGNDDKLFKASNIKYHDRKAARHGYSAKESEDVNEKVLTFAEKKKREEIAQAIERDHPEYSMQKKMAIATAQAKKVAEQVEQFDDILEAVIAEQDNQEVEAITTMLEAMYESLEDDQSREQFIDMLESDEKFEQLLDTVQNILAEETQDE